MSLKRSNKTRGTFTISVDLDDVEKVPAQKNRHWFRQKRSKWHYDTSNFNWYYCVHRKMHPIVFNF